MRFRSTLPGGQMLVRSRAVLVLALAVGLLLAACTATSSPSATSSATASQPPASASVEPSASATDEPSASQPAASESGAPSGPVVVTFLVADEEEYRILLTDPADIEIARQLLAGEEAPRIPNGLVVRGDDGGVNDGYSWHIDPSDVEFADVTIEVCDGMPSDVERGLISGERFCPWTAEVVAIDEP
jgi:hypothetical protein